MTRELFNQIISQPFDWDYIDELNYLDNKEVYQYRIAAKGTDKPYYRWLIAGFNYDSGSVYTNDKGDRNLAAYYHYGIFTEEQWEDIIPQIFYRDFNEDFDKLTKKVLPLFRKIQPFYNDLHLEIWQGIFSFGNHWAVSGKEPKDSINSPKNGKVYCNTLLEIYPYFKEFLEKWPNGHNTLYRFTDAIGPGTCAGILYEDLYEK